MIVSSLKFKGTIRLATFHHVALSSLLKLCSQDTSSVKSTVLRSSLRSYRAECQQWPRRDGGMNLGALSEKWK